MFPANPADLRRTIPFGLHAARATSPAEVLPRSFRSDRMGDVPSAEHEGSQSDRGTTACDGARSKYRPGLSTN